MDNKRKPLLDIATLVERPMVKIDGELQELVSPEELSILASQRLASDGRRLNELMTSDKLDEDGDQELEKLLVRISDTIMEPVPKMVRAKLSGMQRLEIIQAFTALLLRKKAGSAAAMINSLIPAIAVPKATGETISPGSSGSTAATRDTGSPKRR
ncbi:MAG: hypothetical protein QUV08_03035 [Parasphingorhabdus sp.]|nr:hypothetical protein [Parasphingorhabdus sp.]|tara:strand:+ start:621 stop:1088 length:468 start_codon:yes stop_codon:yes gene_type:complete